MYAPVVNGMTVVRCRYLTSSHGICWYRNHSVPSRPCEGHSGLDATPAACYWDLSMDLSARLHRASPSERLYRVARNA